MSLPRGSGSANQPAAFPARIANAFTALDEAEIRWALLRPVRSIHDPDGDIDILVAPPDMVAVRRTLEAAGFVSVASGWPGDAVMVDLDRVSGTFCWLHVQPVVRIELDEIEAAGLLSRAVRRDGVTRIGDADLLALLALHGLLDSGTIKAKYRDDLVSLVAAGAALPTWAVDLAERRGFDTQLLQRGLSEADWAGLENQARGLAVRRPTMRNRASGRVVSVRRIWRRRGMSVAIIGPDGAGKSSLVEALSSRLPAPTTPMYMGLTGGRMPRADRLKVPGVVLAARLTLIWVRRLVAWNHQLRRTIVLFDRYPIDGGVPPGYPCTVLGRWSRNVQRWSCPPPDLAILLDAPGVVLHQRSGEYDADTLEAWRLRYLELASKRPWIHVVDARRPAADIVDAVAAQVWELYRERWSPRTSDWGVETNNGEH